MMSPLMLTTVLLTLQVPAAAPDRRVQAVDSAGGVIEGIVRTQEGAEARPLPYAIIQATTSGKQHTILADSLGRYRIEALPQGTVRLRVSHLAHRTTRVSVAVPHGETVSVDIDLEWRPILLRPVVVIADPIIRPITPTRADPPIPSAEVVALGVSAGMAEAGLGEAAAALPGNDPVDPSDVLFMRGSTTDLKLVLLDGAPVYTPFHLGGLINSFDASTVGAATLHTGGAPARYDGGLSYILDLRTRAPERDRLHVRGGLDLISGNIAAEGPIGQRVGFSASSRSLHDYGAPLLGGGHTPYGYSDALGRVDAQLGDQHRLSATGFWNEESVLLNLNPGESDPGASFAVPEDASWGNHALVLAYHGAFDRLGLDATISASGYQAELPLQPSLDGPPASADNDGLLANAETDRLRFTLDGSAPLGGSRIRFGLSVDRTDILYSASRFEDLGTDAGVAMKADGLSAGVYLDGVRNLAPGLDLRLGARVDAFSKGGGVRVSPRIALLWGLSDQALLTVAAGRYHQFSRILDHQVDLAVSEGPLAASVETLLSVATADHLTVSLDQQLSDRIRIGIEGFWKAFDGLGGPGADILQNSGVDLQVLHESAPLTAWVGYNLSWFWSGEGGSGGTSNFMGRQLLSAGLRGLLNGRTGGAVTLGYSAGLPYTSIPYASEDGLATVQPSGAARSADLTQEEPMFAGRPDDGFLRLDVELFTRFTTSIRGQEFEVRPYVRLINALDQRDALFYYFQPWRDANLQPLAERSLLPVFGVEWRF